MSGPEQRVGGPVADDRARVAIRRAIESVYRRHNGHDPLNHVNAVEWIDAVAAALPTPAPEAGTVEQVAFGTYQWTGAPAPAGEEVARPSGQLTDDQRNDRLDAVLTADERRSLGCDCWQVDGEWHHARKCPVPTVERILTQRGAADQATP